MDSVKSEQGDTVELIAYKARGQSAGVTEEIFELNPGLADLGVILPVGTTVNIPEPPVRKIVRDVRRIWS